MPNYWVCRGNSVFLITDDGPSWLGYLEISSIEWLSETDVENCRYCGGRNKDDALKCEHCGAALNGNPGAIVTVWTKLPAGRRLIHLSQFNVLELLHRECGRRDEYDPGDVFLRLTVRKIDRKAFDYPVIFDLSLDSEFGMSLTFRCEMEFLGALSGD